MQPLYRYNEATDTITDLAPLMPTTLVRHSSMLFSAHHFEQVRQALAIVPVGSSVPDAKMIINVNLQMHVIWDTIKKLQIKAKKAGQTGPLLLLPEALQSENIYPLLIVLLRLEKDQDLEVEDGIPCVQILVNESTCKKMNLWLNMLSPIEPEKSVHPVHLIAFGRLFAAQNAM